MSPVYMRAQLVHQIGLLVTLPMFALLEVMYR